MVGFIRKNKKLIMLSLVFLISALVLVMYLTKDSAAASYDFYEIQQCDDNVGYSNPYQVEARYHTDQFIGHFELEDFSVENGNVFGFDGQTLTLYSMLDADINNLFGSSYVLSDDTWSGDVFLADFEGQKIGKGAIYIEETYYNASGEIESIATNKVNVFASASRGDRLKLLEISKECDVRVLLVYEVTNKLGTWTDNFRLSYTFSVRNISNTVYAQTIEPEAQYADEIPAQNVVGIEIPEGSTVFNGFTLSYKLNKFYTTYVFRNGNLIGTYNFFTIEGQRFTEEGVYLIVNINAFGEESRFDLTVDRYKPFGVFNNINHNNIFSGFTALEWTQPQGYAYRSKVSLDISFDGSEFVPYESGQVISEPGAYKIRLKNYFYTVTYNFYITEIAVPYQNYNNLTRVQRFQNASTRFYAVNEGGNIYCFSDYVSAYTFALDVEYANVTIEEIKDVTIYTYNGYRYVCYAEDEDKIVYSEFMEALNSVAENNVYVKYASIFEVDNLIYMDNALFDTTSYPYLNGFEFTSNSPIFSNAVYYIRQEDYPDIKVLDLATAKSIGRIFEYDIPVETQLTKSGTYLILDTNIYEHTYFFKAYYVKENSAVVKLRYDNNGIEKELNITCADNNGIMTVDKFAIKSIVDKYDPYTVVKVESGDFVDYYIASDILDDNFKIYSTAGEYVITCYDRNGNSFTYNVEIREPIEGQVLLKIDDNYVALSNGSARRVNNEISLYFNVDCDNISISKGAAVVVYELLPSEIYNFNYVQFTYENTAGTYYICCDDSNGNPIDITIKLVISADITITLVVS